MCQCISTSPICQHPQFIQLGERGEPQFNLWFYLLHKDGRHASVTLRGPKQFALADERGVRMEECVALFT